MSWAARTYLKLLLPPVEARRTRALGLFWAGATGGGVLGWPRAPAQSVGVLLGRDAIRSLGRRAGSPPSGQSNKVRPACGYCCCCCSRVFSSSSGGDREELAGNTAEAGLGGSVTSFHNGEQQKQLAGSCEINLRSIYSYFKLDSGPFTSPTLGFWSQVAENGGAVKMRTCYHPALLNEASNVKNSTDSTSGLVHLSPQTNNPTTFMAGSLLIIKPASGIWTLATSSDSPHNRPPTLDPESIQKIGARVCVGATVDPQQQVTTGPHSHTC